MSALDSRPPATPLPRWEPALWPLLWGVLVVAALAFRPPLPVDETRYLAVAWEMWLRGDFLVPHLNGEPYSHKPPLLFWLFHAGWAVFGVNGWWPPLVAPLFALGAVGLTAALGRRLWPASAARRIAPLLLLGSLFWALYSTLTLFDMMVAFATLAGVLGLVDAASGRRWRGWLLYAAALGLGGLSKGPVVLVYLLPAALFAPYWARGLGAVGWRGWYLSLLGAVALGVAITLAWAVPAGLAGGEEYRQAIFWGQSAGRIVDAFDHKQPFWWYAPFLLAIALPWLLWPPLWRAFRAGRGTPGGPPDAGLRLSAVVAVAAILVLSGISGKRLHYLLPTYPFMALFAARFLARLEAASGARRGHLLPIAILYGAVGALMALTPEISATLFGDTWGAGWARAWAAPVILGAAALAAWPLPSLRAQAASVAALGILCLISVHGVAAPRLAEAYDLRPLARYLAELQRQGYTLASFGKYHGQFNFLGRLTEKIHETGSGEVAAWIARHPKSKIISYHRSVNPDLPTDRVTPYRGRFIAVWDSSAVAGDESLLYRK